MGSGKFDMRLTRVGVLAGLIWSIAAGVASAVMFTYSDPSAKGVTLAGDFNQWNKDALEMKKSGPGDWVVDLDLKPGKYEYKFVVDGDWDKANASNRTITVAANSPAPKPSPTDVIMIPKEKGIKRKSELPFKPLVGPEKEIGIPVTISIPEKPAAPPKIEPALEPAREEEPPPQSIFTYENAAARRVTLAGDFNEWNKDVLPMTKLDDGKWETRLTLKPGRYDYKFVVDGDWDKANKDNRTVTVKKGKSDVGTRSMQAAAPAPLPTLTSSPTSVQPSVVQPPALPTRAAPAAVPDKIGATFRYKASGANRVGVGGEFNQWKWESNLMTKGPGDVWMAVIPLSPGEYAYKIVVDGDWREDPDNPLKKEIGGMQNSMIRVTAASPAVPTEDALAAGLTPGPTILGDETVQFVYSDPSADQVYLAGSFNNWIPDAWPMAKRGDGLWIMTVKLKSGIYTYKYYTSGVWKTDPANPKTKDGGFGPDSVLEVGPPPAGNVKVPTIFRVDSKKARRVTLAGDFNGWDPNGIELRAKGGGVWETTIDLKPGKYEYKFVEDGDWESLNKSNQKIEVR